MERLLDTLILIVTKRLFATTLSCAVVLSAADFWASKPFSDWNDKEMQKIAMDSPWAKKVSVSMDGPSVAGLSGPAAGGGRGKGGGNPGATDAGEGPPEPISASGRGAMPSGGGGGEGGGLSSTVIVSWQTALPIRQVIAKTRYGKEVGTSDDAKKFLEREDPYYVVAVSQMPVRGRTGEEFRDAVVKSGLLTVKGKDSVGAMDAKVEPQGRVANIYIIFPKQRIFTLEDGEIEFSAKIGGVPVKQRFKLKDMVYNGKLEL